jgi:hypothetical protein
MKVSVVLADYYLRIQISPLALTLERERPRPVVPISFPPTVLPAAFC